MKIWARSLTKSIGKTHPQRTTHQAVNSKMNQIIIKITPSSQNLVKVRNLLKRASHLNKKIRKSNSKTKIKSIQQKKLKEKDSSLNAWITKKNCSNSWHYSKLTMAQLKKYSVIVKKLNVSNSTVIVSESIRLVTAAIVMDAAI